MLVCGLKEEFAIEVPTDFVFDSHHGELVGLSFFDPSGLVYCDGAVIVLILPGDDIGAVLPAAEDDDIAACVLVQLAAEFALDVPLKDLDRKSVV